MLDVLDSRKERKKRKKEDRQRWTKIEFFNVAPRPLLLTSLRLFVFFAAISPDLWAFLWGTCVTVHRATTIKRADFDSR